MRKTLVALIVGIVLGAIGTLATQRLAQAPADSESERAAEVFQSVPVLIERALPGSKFLDVGISMPSTHHVNYQPEALYDVDITYAYRGEVKRIVLPFGFASGTLIVPAVSDIVIANDKATVEYRLRAPAPE